LEVATGDAPSAPLSPFGAGVVDAGRGFAWSCRDRLLFGLRTDSQPDCVFEIAADGSNSNIDEDDAASCTVAVGPRQAGNARKQQTQQQLPLCEGGCSGVWHPQPSHAHSAGSFLQCVGDSCGSFSLAAANSCIGTYDARG
jgi:hypothetical protein